MFDDKALHSVDLEDNHTSHFRTCIVVTGNPSLKLVILLITGNPSLRLVISLITDNPSLKSSLSLSVCATSSRGLEG